MRRFLRLINAFRRKIENHTAAVALHSMYYNFVRVHQTLKATPAMAVGVTDIYAKQEHLRRAKSAPPEAGDVWTWTAIDADTKLLVSWLVGNRDTQSALIFMNDLKSRVAGRMQITSDGHRPYLQAVDTIFGNDVDYAMLQKVYGADPIAERRYSPAICLGAYKRPVTGNPDLKHVSTSFAERQNLSMRMHMRRFTRLTNGFSRRIENHTAAVALYSLYYNFARVHQTLKVTPAMAAGVTDKLWEVSDIVQVLEDWEAKTKAAPKFEIEANKIGEGYFVRATLPSGKSETIYGFAYKASAAKWIRNESVVWLHAVRQTIKVPA